MDAAFGLGGVVEQKAAELIEIGSEIVPVRHAGEVQVIDTVGQQDAVELIEAPEGVVSFKGDIPAGAPPAGEREIALGDDAAAEAIKLPLVGRIGVEVAPVLVDAGEFDGILAIGEALPPVAHPEDALAGHVARMEGEIVGRREGEIIRDLGEEAEIARVAHFGGEEAGLALHGWIGVLEVGQAENRHAKHFELGILVADGLSDLIMRDGARRDAPQGRLRAVGAAGRELGVFEFGDVAVAADTLFGGDARVVDRDHAQRLDESIAEIIGEGVALGTDDIAVGIAQNDVALCGERVGCLVVDDFVGGEIVVLVLDLDVALGDDLGAFAVVDEFVGLKVKGQTAIELLRFAEDAIFGFGKRSFRFGVLGGGWRGRDQLGGDAGDGCEQAKRERGRRNHKAASRRRFPCFQCLRLSQSTHHSAILLVQKHRCCGDQRQGDGEPDCDPRGDKTCRAQLS